MPVAFGFSIRRPLFDESSAGESKYPSRSLGLVCQRANHCCPEVLLRATLIRSAALSGPSADRARLRIAGLLAHRPSAVDGLCRVRGDLKSGAVMVRIATGNVVTVIRHELHHLQRAFRAIDIR